MSNTAHDDFVRRARMLITLAQLPHFDDLLTAVARRPKILDRLIAAATDPVPDVFLAEDHVHLTTPEPYPPDESDPK